jgi:hypothetical protein
LADVHITEEGAAFEPLAVMRFLIAGTVITKLRYAFYIVSMRDQGFELAIMQLYIHIAMLVQEPFINFHHELLFKRF